MLFYRSIGGQHKRFVFDENMMAVPEPVHGGTAALIKCFDSLNKRAALCAAFYHD